MTSDVNCNNKNTGIHIRNILCKVLWRKKIMPHKAPNAPPKNENRSKINSGIRVFWYTAKCLSQPNNAKVNKLIVYKTNKSG